MTVVSIGVAMLQKAGVTMSTLFLALGVANIVIATAIARTMPKRDQ